MGHAAATVMARRMTARVTARVAARVAAVPTCAARAGRHLREDSSQKPEAGDKPYDRMRARRFPVHNEFVLSCNGVQLASRNACMNA